MATTTTTTTSLRGVLADYELHRSKPESEPTAPVTLQSEPSATNPPDWPTDHRRVPAYRPVNTRLDPAERIVFNSRPEQMFIRTMFFGIRVVTVFHRTWTMTGGKVYKEAFCYDLGGEY